MNDSRKNYEHHEEFDPMNYHTNSCYNMDFFPTEVIPEGGCSL